METGKLYGKDINYTPQPFVGIMRLNSCIISPISPSSHPFRTPTSCPFLSQLLYPLPPVLLGFHPLTFPSTFDLFDICLLHLCTTVNLSQEKVPTHAVMSSTRLKSVANTWWKRLIITAVSNLHVVFPACLAAKITTQPGQVGACNGYILEGDELETLLNTRQDLRLSMERKAEKQ